MWQYVLGAIAVIVLVVIILAYTMSGGEKKFRMGDGLNIQTTTSGKATITIRNHTEGEDMEIRSATSVAGFNLDTGDFIKPGHKYKISVNGLPAKKFVYKEDGVVEVNAKPSKDQNGNYIATFTYEE